MMPMDSLRQPQVSAHAIAIAIADLMLVFLAVLLLQ
jgi:hypothetical protein